MENLILWLYIANLTLLIIHEMDSVYHEEWEMFGLKGGAPFFLILHIPLIVPLLYGMVLLERGTLAGMILALVGSVFGIGAFVIHAVYNARGDERFQSRISQIILWLLLAGSIALGTVTGFYLIKF